MTFEEWMQARLTAHGHPVSIDGALGGETRQALIAFQQKKKLKQTGVADQATIGALRMEPDSKIAVMVPQERMPPWMSEVHRRMGLHETRDKGVLSAFLKLGKFLGDPSRLPWCGDMIESAIVKTLPFEPELILATVSSTKPSSGEPGCAADASFQDCWADAGACAIVKAAATAVSIAAIFMNSPRGRSDGLLSGGMPERACRTGPESMGIGPAHAANTGMR